MTVDVSGHRRRFRLRGRADGPAVAGEADVLGAGLNDGCPAMSSPVRVLPSILADDQPVVTGRLGVCGRSASEMFFGRFWLATRPQTLLKCLVSGGGQWCSRSRPPVPSSMLDPVSGAAMQMMCSVGSRVICRETQSLSIAPLDSLCIRCRDRPQSAARRLRARHSRNSRCCLHRLLFQGDPSAIDVACQRSTSRAIE